MHIFHNNKMAEEDASAAQQEAMAVDASSGGVSKAVYKILDHGLLIAFNRVK